MYTLMLMRCTGCFTCTMSQALQEQVVLQV